MQNLFQVSFHAADIKKLLDVPDCTGIVVKLEIVSGATINEAKLAISATPMLHHDTDTKTKKAKKTLNAARVMEMPTVEGCPHPPGCGGKEVIDVR